MDLSPGHTLVYTVPNGRVHIRADAISADEQPFILVQSLPDGDPAAEPEWAFTILGHEDGWDEPNPCVELRITGPAFLAYSQAPGLMAALTRTRGGEPVVTTLREVATVLDRFGAKDITEQTAARPFKLLEN